MTSYLSPTLVRPPRRTPAPDDGLIAGQAPATGAGSVTSPQPGMAPAPLPGMTALPFGNGVAPAPGTDWGGPMVNAGLSPTGLSAPSGTPMVTPGLPAAQNPADGNLGGTAILPNGANPVDPGPVISGVAPSGAPILGAQGPGSPILGGAPTSAPILGGTDPGAAISPSTDPRLSQYRGMLDKSAGDLANTDRRSMLSSLLNDFDTQSAERDDASMTAVGRRGAALGRLGSGMVSQDINQVARQSNRDKQQFRNQLAQQTIGDEIGDRFSKTSMFRGLAGDEYGNSRGERDELRGERGYRDDRGDLGRREARGERSYFDDRGDRYRDEARGERGYADDFGSRARSEARGERGYFDNRGDQYRDEARGERSWRYNAGRDAREEGRSDRAEYRGERSYQDGRESYDTDRRIQQRELEDRFTNSAMDRAGARLNAGRYSNPTGAYQSAAGDAQAASDAQMQAIMKYIEQYGRDRGDR